MNDILFLALGIGIGTLYGDSIRKAVTAPPVEETPPKSDD